GAVIVPLAGARTSARAAAGSAAVRAGIADHVASDIAGLAEIRTLGAAERRLTGLAALESRLADASRRGGVVAAIRRALTIVWPYAAAIAVLT
ncbi:hypothetical protein SB717_35295, partial [Priestia sp. SIMBA_032]|uniref:hypothetical protein n=1 Tax=Priestia sp. SIMBA_032 TaxID=3085775 RepID=UPI00397BC21B